MKDVQKTKDIILEILKKEEMPIGMQFLLEKLGPGFSERSVRRWVGDLIKEGLVVSSGKGRATKIRARSEVEEAKVGCFSHVSSLIIEKTRQPLHTRPYTSYAMDWFDLYIPNKTFYLSRENRTFLHHIGERLRREDPAGTYAHQIYNRLLINLSFNSSRLEGNTYSLLDTQRLLLEGKNAVGKLEEEAVMILNHKEAIRYLVDTAQNITSSKTTICTLHFLLAQDLLEENEAGKVRHHVVRIAGSTYLPYEDPRILESQLARITEKAELIQDPYEKSIFLLINISYLQYFADVNKRTARIAANIPLIKQNLVPLSFNDVEREDYNSALIAVYELQDVRPFVDLYMYSYERGCTLYSSTVKAMGFDEVRVRFRQQRRALIREIITQKLSGASLESYILSSAAKTIPQENRVDFIEDTQQDLKHLDLTRLAGLGVTPEELADWRALQ